MYSIIRVCALSLREGATVLRYRQPTLPVFLWFWQNYTLLSLSGDSNRINITHRRAHSIWTNNIIYVQSCAE